MEVAAPYVGPLFEAGMDHRTDIASPTFDAAVPERW